MDRGRYPERWELLTAEIRARAGERCECAGECGQTHALGRCTARQGDPSTRSSWPVILTTAHPWQGPCAKHEAAGVKCDDPTHLKAMCQACHLAYDRPKHVEKRRAGLIAREDLSRG